MFKRQKQTLFYVVLFLSLLIIINPSAEAKKKKKQKDKDKQEETTQEIQDEPFEFFLNLVQGERSRDSQRQYIIIKIDGRKITYHSEFHGRPRKSIPQNYDATYILAEPQWQGLLAELQKNGLLQNFTEEKEPVGTGNYVKLTLKIKHQGQSFESKLSGMSTSLSNKDNQISEEGTKFQESLLIMDEYIKKFLPKPEGVKK